MDADMVKARILDAAESLFFNQGIAVSGMDDVARAAEVAIATLYKYGGSKDELLSAVLRRRLDLWVEHWDAARARADGPVDRGLAVFDALETFRAAAAPTQWCCFLATASERPATTAAEQDPALTLTRQDSRVLGRRLRADLEAADVPDPAAVAADLVLIYNGVLASLLRGSPEAPVRRARALAEARIRTALTGAP
ncbi:hypothetical protein GCM10011519_25180 [Marmoricola endophyticus]|uniref:HTH tetR-type domain-containing protein n=1 Tax=Marmoricola endophyticus TaxID=2040280 RepID=A0A917F627_9ACTN|nr:TetR/AcrR family transcriptional regulator [Marmoricola endophyticus]GGF50158.1 hypothetical protein GCM10011519_25180 [Marmoricola endophyticus]